MKTILLHQYIKIILKKPLMLIDTIIQHAKQIQKSVESAPLITIHQTSNAHADFLTINFLIYHINRSQAPVTFVAIRENYSHYSSLAKKLGFSFEAALKNKTLVYIQLFQHSYCSELPLLETSPNSYTYPPKTIINVSVDKLSAVELPQKSILIVDSVSFFYDNSLDILNLYEQAVNKDCKVILSGMNELMNQDLQQVFEREAQISIKLLSDVGGFGKFEIYWNQGNSRGNQKGKTVDFLWKFIQGRFQISRHAIL